MPISSWVFNRLHAMLVVTVLAATVPVQAVDVVSVMPAAHTLSALPTSTVSIRLNEPIDRFTVTSASFRVFGRWSGPARGSFSFDDSDRVVIFTPDEPFSAGESVTVSLARSLSALHGNGLRAGGYSYQFWVRAGIASAKFTEIDRFSTRTSPAVNSRAYGGIASDLNGDRFLDITIVNEDTADLRVFLNRADGTGLYDDFLQPTSSVNTQASPSEPADFNDDGFVDICVANIAVGTVSVLLGNGDGTFGPQQEISVGAAPRGIAVLDADGDGDTDIINTNFGSNNLSVLLNDGTGVFGAPTFFDSGAAGEWALATADMNNDGLLDAVVGARSAQQIVVLTGNGDGTFTPVSTQASGGNVWMLNCGDVNGDGTEDVVCANSFNNNGSVLLGDGTGQLAPPQTYVVDPFPIATDLGDLDGDGDLDWVTSSFSGDWFRFTNDGTGKFSLAEELPAPAAASCALMFDADNDGDLDLALIDELADEVIIMQNSGAGCAENAQCDDGTACNGVETCVDGVCLAGGDPCPGAICRESDGTCVECLSEADCDDDDPCNGLESCDGSNACLSGAPQSDCNQNATEDACDIAAGTSEDANLDGVPDECFPCAANSECADGDACSFDRCVEAVCFSEDAAFGDLASAGGVCGPDGSIDLFDIFAALDAFTDVFADGCDLTNLDIAGQGDSCQPDGAVDLFDIFATLDAFQGVANCCTGGS